LHRAANPSLPQLPAPARRRLRAWWVPKHLDRARGRLRVGEFQELRLPGDGRIPVHALPLDWSVVPGQRIVLTQASCRSTR